MNKIKYIGLTALLAMMFGLTTPAFADESMKSLLKILRDKGNISQSEYESLLSSVTADKKAATVKTNKTSSTSDNQINTKGKLEVKSADEKHNFRIGGRLQWDVTLVDSDGTYSGESETQFRRARLYLSGTTHKFWDFKFQYDFEDADDDDQAIEDAYIRYTGLPIAITLGQRKSPYSMYEFTSSKYTTFIERSLASEFFNSGALGVGNRGLGVTLTHRLNDIVLDGDLLLEGGYYFLRTPAGIERALDDGQGFSGRAVWADYDSRERHLLLLGLSGGYRNYGNNSIGRIRVRPNVSEGDRIVDTDAELAADSYASFNLNFAAMYQRFWGSAEYFQGSFDLINSTGDDEADGYYVQAGVFLTNDSRRYKNGGWVGVKPVAAIGQGGIGAWEVALRYDRLSIGDALHAGTNDEEGSTFSAALNWYPINNIRFQANYVDVLDCDNDCDFTGDPSFFILRSQIFF